MADDMVFSYPATGGGQQSGSGSSQSSQSTQTIPGMLGVYQQLLGLNQSNYQNVMNAYSDAGTNLSNSLPGVYSGYDTLGGNVMNTLGMGQVLGQDGNWGVATPAAQELQRQNAQAIGNTTQQMVNSGLGNTTALAQAQNQNSYNYGQNITNLGAQLASTAAGYQSQIGQAGLGARMTGLQTQTGLTQAALGPLGQQFGNTAGSLTGGFGNSSSSNKETSQQNNQGGQQSGGSSSSGNSLPAGVPGGPGGYSGGGGANGGGGSGDPNLVAGGSAYGAGSTATGSGSRPVVGSKPGGTQTLSPNAGGNSEPEYPGSEVGNEGENSDSSYPGSEVGNEGAAADTSPAVAKQFGADVIDPKAGPPPNKNAKPLISLRGAANDSRIVTRVITGWE